MDFLFLAILFLCIGIALGGDFNSYEADTRDFMTKFRASFIMRMISRIRN